MKYRHIIWDWNGTLLDDLWLSVAAMNRLLSRRKMQPLSTEHYLEIFTFPVKDYYERLGYNFKVEAFSISGTEFIQEYTGRMLEPELHEGAVLFLNEVHDRGLTQSLLSAAGQPMLEKLMDYHGLRKYFTKLIGQDNHYANGKIEAGKLWMEELHYGIHEVLFIGDTIHDLEVAEAIGADCILLSHGHTSHARLLKTGSRVFRNYKELAEWFKKEFRI